MRSTQAAQAQLLASEDGRYAVMATLVAQVGQAYLTLRALDLTLEISRRTVGSRTQSLDLVQARVDGGVAGMLDVRQAENLLYSAHEDDPRSAAPDRADRKTSSTPCSARIPGRSSAGGRSTSRSRPRRCPRACPRSC